MRVLLALAALGFPHVKERSASADDDKTAPAIEPAPSPEPADASSPDATSTDGPQPAVAEWERLLSDREAMPERIYNEGVARFREGALEPAARLFASAAARGRALLAARSQYNRGTTSYAEAVRLLPPPPDASMSPDGGAPAITPELIGAVERALKELKDAVRADPSNADARANAELAHRLLKSLQQQEQQNHEQQNQEQQNQEQQNQDQQNQDQQNQDQQNQDQQNQDQQNQDQQNQDQQNQEQQNQEQQNQDQQNQDQQNQEQQNQEQQQQQAAEKKPLSKEEIERLLQRIREKERARLLDQISRERARTKPAPKDW